MLYVDRRLLGVEYRYQCDPGQEDELGTPVHPVVLNSVCFICSYDPRTEKHTPVGTGFFVAWDEIAYLVTARHCVSHAQDEGDGRAHVRLNQKNGPPDHRAVIQSWITPKDLSVDIALTPFDFAAEDDVHSIPRWSLLTPDRIRRQRVGLGDAVWLAGMFWPVLGEEHMRPIIRVGTIAATPRERIATGDAEGKPLRPFEAYLIEVRSVGGLSGAPVWVHLPPGRSDVVFPHKSVGLPEKLPHHIKALLTPPPGRQDGDFLLGVIRLHWKVDDSTDPLLEDYQSGVVNMGIAGVTPIAEVVALLEREDVMGDREKRKSNAGRRGGRGTTSEDATPTRRPPGPEPKRLKIDDDMDDAVRRMFDQGKPPKE